MTDRAVPKLSKWPFLVSDAALLMVAAWIALRPGASFGLWAMVICAVAVAFGAWICILPFLREHDAALKMAEAESLTSAVAEIRNLEVIQAGIAAATGHWQAIQDQVVKTLQSAREVSDRMGTQTEEFSTFFQRANDHEKNTLKLEVEKLKRAEGEWLQVLVRILDNVYALHMAGLRSGQEGLIRELTQFQGACREAARRVGLIPFAPEAGEPFDPRMHQTPDGAEKAPEGARVEEALATGYSFQAQLLRRSLVRVTTDRPDPTPGAADGESSSPTTTDPESGTGPGEGRRDKAGPADDLLL